MYLLPAGSGMCVVNLLSAFTLGELFSLNFSYGDEIRCCLPPVAVLFVIKVPVILSLCRFVVDFAGEMFIFVV
jgi:hypothetical protein